MAQGRKTTQTNENVGVSGPHIYLDERGRCVYFDVFSKNGYILANNESKYKQLSMRFMLGLIALILMLMFNMPIWICILVGILVYGFMEYKFRRFLNTLTKIENFKCNEKAKSSGTIKSMDTNKVWVKFFCLVLFAVLIVVNAQNEGYSGMYLYLNYIVCALSVIYALYHLKEILSRKK